MDTEKIQQFVIHHFEKMILVLIIAGSGYLVFQGLQLPNLLDVREPDRLSADATQVKADLDEDHNEAIIPERIPTFDIVKATRRIDEDVAASPYLPPKLWDNTIVGSKAIRRQDPTLAPPLELMVTPVVTTISVRGSTSDPEDYLLARLEDAGPVKRDEAKKTRRPRRPRRGRGMEDEMQDAMEDSMEESMMEGMMMRGGEEMGSMSTATRTFPDESNFGTRPGRSADRQYPKPAIGWFIAGTALLPHKEIYEAFQFALESADGYDARRRDTPIYYNLEVQRADVTTKPVDQLVDGDWVKIWDRTLYTKLAARRWAGFAPDIVHEEYRDPSLTLWFPPVLIDDYRPFSTHPKIPTKSQQEMEMIGKEVEFEEAPAFDFNDQGDSLRGPTGLAAAPAEMVEMRTQMMGAMSIGTGGIEETPVQYKLLRFYDFIGFPNSPEVGNLYVYRLRYSVNDPNFPGDPVMQPRPNILAPDVNPVSYTHLTLPTKA